MNQSLITVRYAKALFELSEEEGCGQIVKTDIEGIFACINGSEELTGFLASPLLKGSEKVRIMGTLFQKEVHPLTFKFIELLFDHKRELYLAGICRNFLQLYKASKGIKEALITTAIALSDAHKKEIHSYINKKFKMDVELSERVDPSIIGGFILRIEDQQINASIQSKLNKIKRELINS
jgi:F-type H+-transporting ATPase subunit delta